ncbi:uncharacterized protein LOC141632464 [Silene latifolia]|uniref:uncharacterized protein LOC141632464 n=1 Tax=Silene latifolia TaxID=37657 RepID=UPI003D76B6D7
MAKISSTLRTIETGWVRNVKQMVALGKFGLHGEVNPYMKLQEIVDTIWSERGIEVSIFTAHKAQKKAQQLILGEYMEQYGWLHRPFISIYGCFLKGPYGGQLLVHVGRDENNQMFPIVWAVVEVENYDCRKWFLGLLADDLNTTHESEYTIMSNQQKGLIKAVIKVWAQAEHRCCSRHVYCNFREIFGGGQEYRRAFWRLAKSTNDNEFIEKNLEFSEISVEAAENILNRNYKKWCRAFFSPESQCDNVDNNTSEVFNAYILKLRYKPVITMLEDIRESLMERMHKKRDFIANKDVSICPRIQERLERYKFGARVWLAFWDGKLCFGVREGATQTKYVMNLSARTCSCNAWNLSGVLCNHVVAAIWKKGHQPEDYVANCYRRAAYLKAYTHCLEPLNGPQEWPQTQMDPISPPPLKKLKASKPTTKRRKQAGELVNKKKMSKAGNEIRCSRCGGSGHNKRNCPSSNESSSSKILKNQQHEVIAPIKMHNKGMDLCT